LFFLTELQTFESVFQKHYFKVEDGNLEKPKKMKTTIKNE